jgi:DNA uptake protein ComE-like DNA-binding protein
MKQIKQISLMIMVGLFLLSFCHPLMAADGEKININTASQQELMKLNTEKTTHFKPLKIS